MIAKMIGSAIREYRKSKGWGLKELSRHTGISVQYLSLIENGKVNAGDEKLKKIFSGLGASPSFRLYDNKSKSDLVDIEKRLITAVVECFKTAGT